MSKSNAELRKLADRGRVLREQQDDIDLELDKIKKIFREEAKSRKVGYFLGNEHFVRVSPLSSTDCDPEELEQTLVELDRHSEFYDCVKVRVTEAKTALGETVFNSISVTKSEAYKKVAFLKSIPKKYREK